MEDPKVWMRVVVRPSFSGKLQLSEISGIDLVKSLTEKHTHVEWKLIFQPPSGRVYVNLLEFHRNALADGSPRNHATLILLPKESKKKSMQVPSLGVPINSMKGMQSLQNVRGYPGVPKNMY